MSIVDLAKARAYAESLAASRHLDPEGHAADWILSLADEVESLERTVESARRSEQAALGDAAKASEERDGLFVALTGLYGSITELLTGIGQRAS
jgi:hypothetical protein